MERLALLICAYNPMNSAREISRLTLFFFDCHNLAIDESHEQRSLRGISNRIAPYLCPFGFGSALIKEPDK